MLVPNASVMTDDHLARHLGNRHAESLGGMRFLPLPGETELCIRARGAWLVFHQYLHDHKEYQHDHEEV